MYDLPYFSPNYPKDFNALMSYFQFFRNEVKQNCRTCDQVLAEIENIGK